MKDFQSFLMGWSVPLILFPLLTERYLFSKADVLFMVMDISIFEC